MSIAEKKTLTQLQFVFNSHENHNVQKLLPKKDLRLKTCIKLDSGVLEWL